MTQPDGFLPANAWNDSAFGPISILAATTQSDWEAQLFGQTSAPFQMILDALFEGLQTGFAFPAAFLKMILEHLFGFIPVGSVLSTITNEIIDWLANPGSLSGIPLLSLLIGGDGTLLGNLIPGIDASKIVSGTLGYAITGVQDVIDTIFTAMTGSTQTGNLPSDLLDVLMAIPSLNILGIGGPSDIGTSILTGWTNMISGFLGIPATENATLADLFNIPFEIASRATLGLFSWDYIGIRNNTTLDSGLVPTSESTIKVTSAGTTISVTQALSTIGFQRIKNSAPLGVVGWRGYGNTNITEFYVIIWKMDTTTGDLFLVHNSTNIIGDISTTDAWHEYFIPDGQELAAVAGDVYGTDLVVVGSGTHNVFGQVVAVPDHPRVYPKRFAATNNYSLFPPPPPGLIASDSVVYSNNVPFIELSIKSGNPAESPHAPTKLQIVAGQTVPIPSWANLVDYIILGGGGGGDLSGLFGYGGAGGSGGHWTIGTWVRDVDYGDGVVITVTVGGGGAANGGNGGNTSVSIPGHSRTGAGGAGGSGVVFGGGPGLSPGNATYNGTPYYGGVQQNTLGASGNGPGGAGAGGDIWKGSSPGGAGARGVAFLVFRQS